jgi:hypothetical protein
MPEDFFKGSYPYAAQNESGLPIPYAHLIEADTARQFVPWAKLLHESFQTNQKPLWNPYAFSGSPFLANGQNGAMDPMMQLLRFSDFELGFTLFQFLQMVLAGSFTFLLLCSWQLSPMAAFWGASIFALNPLFRMFSGHRVFSSMVWFPSGSVVVTVRTRCLRPFFAP